MYPTYRSGRVRLLSSLRLSLTNKFQAYPDVAAQGDKLKIFLKGKAMLIGGTSAACPAFAGFVSLLNDARLNAGLPSLGFLNPFLYSKGYAGLNDITIGHNSGCGTQGFNVSQPYV
jgi:tripeptidyl-peptidase-1